MKAIRVINGVLSAFPVIVFGIVVLLLASSGQLLKIVEMCQMMMGGLLK